MKLSVLALTMASAAAFSPATFVRRTRTTETVMHSSNFDLSGNSWQPDSEKMGVSSFCHLTSVLARNWRRARPSVLLCGN